MLSNSGDLTFRLFPLLKLLRKGMIEPELMHRIEMDYIPPKGSRLLTISIRIWVTD